LVKGESNGRVARRILAIANALDGMSREAAAQSAGMDRQTLRDWVIRYNEQRVGASDAPWLGCGITLADQLAQEMHVAAVGSAFRRLGSIAPPHFAQMPYVPSDIRWRAASI
jgi:hypothetical protein